MQVSTCRSRNFRPAEINVSRRVPGRTNLQSYTILWFSLTQGNLHVFKSSKSRIRAAARSATTTAAAAVVVYMFLTCLIKVPQGPILDDKLKESIELKCQIAAFIEGRWRLEPSRGLDKGNTNRMCELFRAGSIHSFTSSSPT